MIKEHKNLKKVKTGLKQDLNQTLKQFRLSIQDLYFDKNIIIISPETVKRLSREIKY